MTAIVNPYWPMTGVRTGGRARLIDALGGGEVTIVGHNITFEYSGRDGGTCHVKASDGRTYMIDVGALQPLAITWKPGDVVVVTFNTLPYTYVRGLSNWPGDRAPAKTDEQMTEWYFDRKLRAVLQNGGRPFDQSRLSR